MYWLRATVCALLLAAPIQAAELISNNWSSASAWTNGKVPARDADVTITKEVFFDVASARLGKLTVADGGSLIFPVDKIATLYLVDFEVQPGGSVQIGTPTTPVTGRVDITFLNQPIDTGKDPEQLGHGLICRGKFHAYGNPRTSWADLTAEVPAGSTTLKVAAAPVGWKRNDLIYLPDTRQPIVNEKRTSQGEYLIVKEISADGKTITLFSPTKYAHLGAKTAEKEIVFLPHVANITRSIQFFSENAAGVPGHTYFNERADVTLKHVGFYNLGRTTNAPLDDTVKDATGKIVKIGKNQRGRYAVHMHHNMGPEGGRPDGYQFVIEGCAVCSWTPHSRWGITIHQSHYGLIKDNAVICCAGAGIATEDGNEWGNRFVGNFVSYVPGTGTRQDARSNEWGFEGSGIWLRGPGNSIVGNVISDCPFEGAIVYYPRFAPVLKRPLTPGGLASEVYDPIQQPIPEFKGNTIYSSRSGLVPWWIGVKDRSPFKNVPRSKIEQFSIWHCPTGISGYEVANIDYNDVTIIGDFNERNGFNGGVGSSDYVQYRTIYRNLRIENMANGLTISAINDELGASGTNPGLVQVLGGRIRCRIGVSAPLPWHNGTAVNLPPITVHLDGVDIVDLPNVNTSDKILYRVANNVGGFVRYPQWVGVFVKNNKRAGLPEQFQVTGPTMLPSAIMTASSADGRVIGAPVPGMTNQQAWDAYGLATGGQLASGEVKPLIPGLVRGLELNKPVIQPLGNRELQPGATLEIKCNAYNPNLRPVLFRLQGAPMGMRIDAATGVLTWSTVSETEQGTYPITVIAEDSTNTLLNSSTSFQIVVIVRSF